MTTSVFVAVLLAACLHAFWNSLIKGSADKNTIKLAVVLGHVPVAIVALPFAPPIDLAALMGTQLPIERLKIMLRDYVMVRPS